MYALLVVVLLLVPIGLALVWPTVLVYGSLLTGAAPVTLGRGEQLTGELGRMDFYAIRLLGLWVAALLVTTLNLSKVLGLISRFRFHVFFLIFAVVTLLWAPSAVYGSRMLSLIHISEPTRPY